MNPSPRYTAHPLQEGASLQDGLLYVARNGRVVKVTRRASDIGDPHRIVWVGRVDGQPRAGAPQNLLYYDSSGAVMQSWDVNSEFDLIGTAVPMVEPAVSGEEVWHTADGRSIPVAEMEVDHLRNALRMMIRRQRRVQRLRRDLYLFLKPAMKAQDDAEALMSDALHNQIMDDVGEDAQWGSE